MATTVNGGSTVLEEGLSRKFGALDLAPGSEVVARYNFSGTAKEDLPFRKDDVLRVVAITQDPNWFKARHQDGREGMVPANYVKRKAEVSSKRMPWLHGQMTREEAEKVLRGQPDGCFLVRESTNFPGDYTLCLSYQRKVEHYRIHWKENQTLTCDEEEFFDTLPELIAHYEKDADGLCHRLVIPLLVEEDATDCGSEGKPRGKELSLDPERTIHRAQLQLGDAIGRGEFADVLIGWYHGKKVAVKVLKQVGNKAMESQIIEEASLMAALRHRNLVQLIGLALDDSSNLCIVSEFMPNGNLVDYLRSRGRHQVTREQQISFACDVCEGMAYLEAKEVVHRDLAARNVLLAEDMTAKISDLGLAKPVDSASSPEDSSGKFPIKWTAPEALRFGKFTPKSDMWSLGVLLWEIYSFGRVPYPRIPIQDVVRHIEKGYRMEAPDGCSPEVATLMSQAWSFKAEQRPSFKQLLVKLKSLEAGVGF